MVMLSPAIKGGICRLLFWTMIKFNSSKNHPKTASELNGKLIVISEEIFIWIYISIAIVISKISIAITIVSGISIAITRVAIAVSIIISIIGVIIGIIAGIAGVICCYITEITLLPRVTVTVFSSYVPLWFALLNVIFTFVLAFSVPVFLLSRTL